MEERGAGVGGANLDEMVFIPLTTVQDRLFRRRTVSGEYQVNLIYASVISEDRMEAAQQQITELLRERHNISFRGEDDFVIINQSDLISIFGDILSAMTVFLSAIAFISLVVGGIGIMNIMLVSVTERTREIGLRKAVGAKRRNVLSQFLIEAVTLALIGGMLGIALGAGGAVAATSFIDDFSAVVGLDAIAICHPLLHGRRPLLRHLSRLPAPAASTQSTPSAMNNPSRPPTAHPAAVPRSSPVVPRPSPLFPAVPLLFLLLLSACGTPPRRTHRPSPPAPPSPSPPPDFSAPAQIGAATQTPDQNADQTAQSLRNRLAQQRAQSTPTPAVPPQFPRSSPQFPRPFPRRLLNRPNALGILSGGGLLYAAPGGGAVRANPPRSAPPSP